MKSHNLVFTRKSGLSAIENLWLVQIDMIDDESGLEDALKGIEASVSDWVRETPEGAAAWEESCEDFNIGDFFCSPLPRRSPFLLRHGIDAVSLVYQMSEGEEICFDRVLVSL
jgi:hypothetical protein